MKKSMISVAIGIFALASCAKQLPSGEGSFSLSVDFPNANKSAMTQEELTASSLVKIYNGDFSGLIRSYKYSEAPSVIYLPTGDYRVDVEAGEMAKAQPSSASWEQKSYSGSANFTIKSGANTSVQVVAGIANAISKVTFDQSVADNFSAYEFTIGLSAEEAAQQLKYTSANSGAEGYFLPSGFEPSFFWSFEGTLAKDGSSVSKSGVIEKIETGKMYSVSPKYTVHDGDLVLNLLVDYSTNVVDDMIVFEAVSTGLSASSKAEIWGGHATIHADVDETEYNDPSKVKFAYTKAGGSDWTTIASVRDGEGAYSAVMTGLKGATAYSYKLVIDGEDVGDPMTLTTEEAVQLPNSNFETVSNCEKSTYVSFYDPSSSDPQLKVKFWDTGSSASTTVGADGAICYSDTDVPAGIGSKKSARLQSKYVVVKFAAGNLFAGEFAGLDGMNGKVNFGRPFTARPTGVKFWYKYSAGKVNHAPSGSPISEGQYDIACVQFALGTWNYKTYGGSKNCPVQVNTSKKETFWKYENLPETIAYGKFEKTGTGSSTGWQQATVHFDYNSTDKWPAYILVSAAASKYGDYFAGCDTATLWLDEMELLYE